MRRFFLPPDQCVGAVLRLRDREARHAVQVLRLRSGDACRVLNGAGAEFHCETLAVHREVVELQVVSKTQHEPSRIRCSLFQAIPKGKTMEAIVQKATELGVTRIVPLLTERVVVELDDRGVAVRLDKWLQTAVESVKQCGCPWLPAIQTPQPLAGALAAISPGELACLASLETNRIHPRAVIETFRREHGFLPECVSLWIGPEGDFSPAEYDALRRAGAQPVSLGRNILRADTAAIAGLAILQSEMEAASAC